MLTKEKIKNNKYYLISFFALLLFLAIGAIAYYYLFLKNRDLSQIVQDKPMPEQNLEPFIAGQAELDNLILLLNTDFIYQPREDETIRFPEEFKELKEGNELDFALFTAYSLRTAGLGEAAVLRYKYQREEAESNINTIVIFRGHNLPPKHIAFGTEGARVFNYGWSFEDLFRAEEQRLGITITEHQMFLLWPLPSQEDLLTKEWQTR